MAKVTKKKTQLGKWKGVKNAEQGKIYDYQRQQFYEEKYLLKNFPWLDDPNSDPKINRYQRQNLTSANYRQHKWTKEERNLLLKRTAEEYRQYIDDERSRRLYWQAQAGATKPSSSKLIKRQEFKFIEDLEDHEKAEHAKREAEFWKVWEDITKKKGSITKQEEVAAKSQLLYQKSPRRIRDRFLIITDQPVKEENFNQIYRRYYTDNNFSYTKRHYYKALQGWLRQTNKEGEIVPDHEIVTDKYGRPVLQPGQVMTFNTNKPGRTWEIRRKVPSFAKQVKKKIHDVAHHGYVQEYGSEEEKAVYSSQIDKSSCRAEAILGYSCEEVKGTSLEWCVFCVRYGKYHPPVLPIHCPWRYTYKTWTCGTQEHPDANKQWHFSREGEKTRSKIKGGDWGSCHFARFDKGKKSKIKRK